MKVLLIASIIVIGWSGFAQAQSLKLSAEDSLAVQDCIKSKAGGDAELSRCIGVVAEPCLDTPSGRSTAGQAGCYQREQLVWDDILNETYRRLQGQLDGKLKTQLRDLQRVWIESRKQQCGFYHDVIQGSLAIPVGENCMNTETARRAIYLLGFLNL